jgi:hypothetical protein
VGKSPLASGFTSGSSVPTPSPSMKKRSTRLEGSGSPETKTGATRLARDRCRVGDAGSGTGARGLPYSKELRNARAMGQGRIDFAALPSHWTPLCWGLARSVRPRLQECHLPIARSRDASVAGGGLAPETVAGKSLDTLRDGSIVPFRVPRFAYVQYPLHFIATRGTVSAPG